MNSLITGFILTGAGLVGVLIGLEVYRKNMHIWLWSYLTRRPVRRRDDQLTHVIFAFCDHFEPQWGGADYETESQRVDRWCEEYPKLAAKHRDADGCPPRHSFFYPEEEYREEHLARLADLCRDGFGEIEIHLHHDRDTAEGLRDKITGFLDTLDTTHGAVAKDSRQGTYQFAFIHGNWALDNSRKDGRWCGVNNELAVLADLGCYVDMTLPSAPSDTQTRKINSIYYAKGRNGCSKSHDTGIDVEVGRPESGDLMILQGPLCLNWRDRKYGLLPRIENSDIRASSPPTPERVDLWVDCAIHVKGRPQWRFVKIHTHGTQEGDIDSLLGNPVDDMFSYLEENYNDGQKYALHYVSAREMFNIVKAAEAGETGDPGLYRDYRIQPPAYLRKSEDQVDTVSEVNRSEVNQC